MGSYYLFIFLIILATGIFTFATETKDLNYRLDDIIKPSHYELEIKSYLLEHPDQADKQFTFDGIVKITLSTKRKYVDKITLNAKGLNITKTELKLESSNSPEIDTNITDINNKTDKIIITVKEYLEPNKDYILELVFSGNMTKDYYGFYYSSYENADKEKIYIAATQFAPNHARKVFPCFDEPKFKSTFELRINRENKYTSNSNMKLSQTIPLTEERSLDIFKTSPILPIYVIAFVITDFKSQVTGNANISFLARSEVHEKLGPAMEAAPLLLQKYNEYLGIPYSSILNADKLEIAVIPQENCSYGFWHFGLIPIRESNLIFNKSKDGGYEQYPLTTLSLEIAHTWFGALVTPRWWNYNWLSESFSEYFSYFLTNEVFPEYQLDKQFSIGVVMSSLSGDSLQNAHSVVNKSEENVSNVNNIIYQSSHYWKGTAILHMIANIIGPEAFQRTVRKYLKRNQYRLVTTDDLLKDLNDEWSNQDVDLKMFLTDWTEQAGYPLVTINLNEDGLSMNVSQKRFLVDVDNFTDTEASVQYTIPFTYTTNLDNNFQITKPKIFVRKNRDEIITLDHKSNWVIANIQQTGHYRVNYDRKTWLSLMAALKSENFAEIHENNRAQIVDDSLNLAHAGILEYKFVLQMLEYLEHEHNYLPWRVICKEFHIIENKLSSEEKQNFRRYTLKIINKIYDKLQFHSNSKDKPLVEYTRDIIRSLACRSGHKDCIINAKTIFDDFIYNNIPVQSRMEYVIYCTTVREHGGYYSNYLWDARKSNEKMRKNFNVLPSLLCSQKKKDLFKVMDVILAENICNCSMSYMLQSYDNVEDVIEYIEVYFEKFQEKNRTADILSHAINEIDTEQQLTYLKRVLNEHKSDFIEDKLNQYFEKLEKKLAFRKKHICNAFQHLGNGRSNSNRASANVLMIIVIYAVKYLF